MVVIRSEQMEAFRLESVRLFEVRAAEFLRAYDPSKCSALGEPLVLVLIRAGIRRCQQYNIRVESGVLLFLQVALAFGADFEYHRRFSWAARVLTDPMTDGYLKALRVYEGARQLIHV
jgi:hypothetical protein